MPTPTVFISYNHKDRDLLGPMAAQLKGLEQAGLLDVWVDTRTPNKRVQWTSLS